MGFNTNTEKIAFLNNVVVALHKSLHYCCLILGIDIETVDLLNFDAIEFASSYPENLPQSQWMARNTIIRDMEKLKIVNKKLDELKNA
jgi:hypothetical protein